MPRLASAKRYAQAIFEIAVDSNDLDVWVNDLTLLAREIEDPEVSNFLDAPQIPTSQKRDLVKGSVETQVGPLAVNLMIMLASRGTVSILPKILNDYQALLDEHNKVERASVTSAVPLDDIQIGDITTLLRGIVQKDIYMNNRVNSSILGGFIARVGDRVLDGSTITKLQGMRKNLSE